MEKDLETSMETIKQETDILLEAEKKALDAAKLFNRIAHGKSIEEYTDVELVKAINRQIEVTMEEVLETITNAEINLVEELDGYADSLYTYPYLELLIQEFNNRDITQDVAKEIKIRRLQYVRQMAVMIMRALPFKAEVVSEASDRVVENNLAKFTTDTEEFNTWTYDDRFKPTVQEVEGVNYYYLVDKNSKVRKRSGFPKVTLEDLVGG